MNERIKELAEQVGFRLDSGEWQFADDRDVGKFAELIVRECAGVVEKDMDYDANWCSDKILKYFGVEE